MKKLIKGGTVVSAHGSRRADLLIEGEKIVKIIEREGAQSGTAEDGKAEPLSASFGEETEVIDASGCLLFPGLIDAHTHLDLHVGGTVTCDDFYSGSKAAVAGGTTSIVDFGTQYHGESLAEGFANWRKKASSGSSCDYGFHMSISEWNESVSRECRDMMDAGISTFKLYMTYDDMILYDEDLFCALKRIKEVGGIAGVHCENPGMIEALRKEYGADEKRRKRPDSHYLTRPASAEAEAVNRLLYLCREAGCDVICVHVSCKEALAEIRAARARGQKVYAETCPHYLLLQQEMLATEDFSGAKYVCAPPLRTKEDNEVLWKAIADGEIQTVSTDHCSFTFAQRLLGKEDFRKIPGGLAGIELRGPLMYSEGVAKGRISAEKMCEVCAENPAKLYGLYPGKGALLEGSDADIVVIDPKKSRVLCAADQVSRCDYSNYEGLPVTGEFSMVFLRGELVAAAGKVVKENTGRFLPRGTYSL